MHHINQLTAKGNHKIIDKLHPVGLMLISRHMSHMQLALVDKILCRKLISVFIRKCVKRPLTHREIIRAPVRIQISVSYIASPNPYKIIEHGGKTHYRCRRMRLAPLLHPAR